MVTSSDVQIQIVNGEYTQDENGIRKFSGTVNYTVQAGTLPSGEKIDMKVVYSTTGGFQTFIQTIPKTLFDVSGSFNFSFFDSDPYEVLTENTMRANVFFWLRDTTIAVSPNVGTEQTLALPIISQNVTITFTDSSIGGFTTSVHVDEVGALITASKAQTDWTVALVNTPSPEQPPLATLSQLLQDIADLLFVEPPPENNISVEIRWTDGHAVGGVITNDEYINELIPFVSLTSATISNDQPTTNPTTISISDLLNQISSHQDIHDIPPSPLNRNTTVTFEDGHTVTGILIQSDFFAVLPQLETGEIPTFAETTDIANKTFIQFIQEVTAHRIEDEEPPVVLNVQGNITFDNFPNTINFILSQSQFNLFFIFAGGKAITVNVTDNVTTLPSHSNLQLQDLVNGVLNQPPPQNNISVGITFPDGHSLGGIVSTSDWLNLVLPVVNSTSASVTSTQNTPNPVTITASLLIDQINSHELADNPPLIINKNITITFDDGHTISEVLTNADFIIVTATISPPTHFTSSNTTTNPVSITAQQLILDINAHLDLDNQPVLDNFALNILFIDGSTLGQNIILTETELGLLQQSADNDDNWFIQNSVDSILPSVGLAFVQQLIAQRLADIFTENVLPTMVTTLLEQFTLKNGKDITGGALYGANANFGSFWFGKDITTIMTVKSEAGATLLLKENTLNFTETERDESITFVETLPLAQDKVTIEIVVWVSLLDPRPFASIKIQTIQNEAPDNCPMGQHRVDGVCIDDNIEVPLPNILTKVMGGIALLGTLALLGSKRR